MQGGKGYSVTLPEPTANPLLCSLLKEGRVAVTPMGGNAQSVWNDGKFAAPIPLSANDVFGVSSKPSAIFTHSIPRPTSKTLSLGLASVPARQMAFPTLGLHLNMII